MLQNKHTNSFPVYLSFFTSNAYIRLQSAAGLHSFYPQLPSYTGFVPVSIEPFSNLDAQTIRDYLVQQGEDSPAVIDWKYFDSTFTRGRERGFACIQNGRIHGTLGLIPFQALINGERLETAWSCDWYRDLSLPGPMGIMLIKHSLRSYPLLYSLGGSAQTRMIMPRLSQYTAATAGIEFHKPLRLGGAIRASARLTRFSVPKSIPIVDHLPLPLFIRRAPDCEAHLSMDLNSALNSIPDPSWADQPCPAYDLPYIKWQLGRCPVISAGVCTVSSSSQSAVAILFWRLVTNKRFWRLAVLGNTNSTLTLVCGLQRVLQHIQEEGGWMASVLASRLDASLLAALKKAGFFSGQRRPLFILNQLPHVAITELQRLSYLDTDYAYRFNFV